VIRQHLRQLKKRGPPWAQKYYVGLRSYLYEQEVRLLPQLVSPGLVSVDVGANNGAYTYHLARLSRSVVAYEPLPELAQFLRRCQFRNTTVVPRALSDASGSAELFVPVFEGRPALGLTRLERGFDAEYTARPATNSLRVDVARLDDEGLTNVGFIKIDVEGHELSVLRGAARLLGNERPNLLVEAEQRHIAFPIVDLFQYLHGHGYEGFFLFERRLLPLSAFDVEVHQRHMDESLRNRTFRKADKERYGNNFVFTPEGSKAAEVFRLRCGGTPG
jgi:FkbM family methyltransferase